jgi:hypothetical protein
MDNLFGRKYVIQGLFIAVALILIGTLFYIQVASCVKSIPSRPGGLFSTAMKNHLHKTRRYTI